MTALGIALLVIGLVLSLVGGVMFLVAAFRVSVTWGLLVLFVPFANLVFLVKYWAEAKKSFFVNAAGCAALVLAFGALATSAVRAGGTAIAEAAAQASAEAQRADAAVPAARPRVRPAVAPGSAAPAAQPEAAPATESALPEPAGDAPALDEAEAFAKLKDAPNAAPMSEEVKAADLPHYIGQRLLLVDRAGNEMRGTLLAIDPRALRIEREISGGSVSYNVARGDVKEIRSLD